jgi:hypothetical protein
VRSDSDKTLGEQSSSIAWQERFEQFSTRTLGRIAYASDYQWPERSESFLGEHIKASFRHLPPELPE